MSIEQDQFRRVMGLFPTGVTVVTAPYGEEQDVGLTISSFTSVSLEPPQILFCLAKFSRSAPVLTTTPHFALNILAARQAYVSDYFAHRTLQGAKPVEVCRDQMTGCLLLPDALGHIICERGPIYEGGDHHIILGHVIAVQVNAPDAPLVRQQGQYLTTRSLAKVTLQKVG
jgi:flavin reductase (DIM6/NTAB) family NADH-FMN oxidoreductase RutF